MIRITEDGSFRRKIDPQKRLGCFFLKRERKTPEGVRWGSMEGERSQDDRRWREAREPVAIANFKIFQKEDSFKTIFPKVVLKGVFSKKICYKRALNCIFSDYIYIYFVDFVVVFPYFCIFGIKILKSLRKQSFKTNFFVFLQNIYKWGFSWEFKAISLKNSSESEFGLGVWGDIRVPDLESRKYKIVDRNGYWMSYLSHSEIFFLAFL